MKKYVIGIIVFGIGFFSFCHFARAADAKGSNVATVDIGKIFEEYEKTKKYDQEFQNEAKSKQEERDAIVHEVRRLRDEEALLSENARQTKHKEIEAKMKELDDFDGRARGALGEKHDKALKEVFQDIEGVVSQYGERKGYDFIYNERALLYRNKRFDVTADILKELNSQYAKQKK